MIDVLGCAAGTLGAAASRFELGIRWGLTAVVNGLSSVYSVGSGSIVFAGDSVAVVTISVGVVGIVVVVVMMVIVVSASNEAW